MSKLNCRRYYLLRALFFFMCFCGVCVLMQWLWGDHVGPDWMYFEDGSLGPGIIVPCVATAIGFVICMIVSLCYAYEPAK